MTVPIIDGIDHETFEYRSVYQGHQHFRGIFEWGMLYKVSLLVFRATLFALSLFFKNDLFPGNGTPRERGVKT